MGYPENTETSDTDAHLLALDDGRAGVQMTNEWMSSGRHLATAGRRPSRAAGLLPAVI